MSHKEKPITSVKVNSENALNEVFEVMKKEGYFYTNNHKVAEAQIAEAREKALNGNSEQWFSNGVHEFKILSGFDGIKIHNFRMLKSDSIQAIQDAARKS